ncbi:nesprin-2 [Hippocampus zosterae]|uniref:nesprin-2 n=1 Tax=Hippocampus zosterae TaxID=109293 RepID=UPI00223DCC21|nr:nesprin-2 [Hippocampus zosterae]
MASDYPDDVTGETGSAPVDIDDLLVLLQVEQEQIQKRTFTNWVNAQLAKRRPPTRVVDLFDDFRDGSKLLDLLEVMSNQRISRERGRGTFRHRINIEKGLSFLRHKSIKLVNINVPDIIDGKPSIILGLVWTVILQYHIEELAGGLSFGSRQSSMESLASLDSGSSRSGLSAGGGPVPCRGSPLHARFRLSAKKALMLWVREQCRKAGCSVPVKDFKGSWRSGVPFLAILCALRCDLVDLSKAAGRSNKQNLDEAFRVAERELGIPRLLEPDDVDVREPDEKSIMTYVAQFLRYSKDGPVSEEDAVQSRSPHPPKAASPVSLPVHYTPAISASPLRQASPDRKAQEVSCWLRRAYEELLEGWDSTQGESYSERYHVFQTFVACFNEQRRPIMPLLSAGRRSAAPSEEQRGLREAWDALTQKLREYQLELDMSLPAPLDTTGRWLLSTEGLLAEEEGDPWDHRRSADRARDRREQLQVRLEEMPQQVTTFQAFPNEDEYGNLLVPTEKMEELKRRFTAVRVSGKYRGLELEYDEHRHALLDLLSRIWSKVLLWKRPYLSPEAVRLLLREWQELVTNQELPSLLETTLRKLKQVSEKYSGKSALAADYCRVCQQVTQLEEEAAAVLAEVRSAEEKLGRVLTAWDSYSDGLSSMQAWLEQVSAGWECGSQDRVTSQSVTEWASRQAHLNEVANFLMESADPQTSGSLERELLKLNADWAQFVHRNTLDCATDSDAATQTRPAHLHALVEEAALLFQEPVQTTSGPLRTYRKRMQLLLRRLKEVELEVLDSSPESSVARLEKPKMALNEVKKTLGEADQACAELQHRLSGLDGRLAELLHWETEAREMCRRLRATERQRPEGQDPGARELISRGLQLEGQVVTEEQDLQALILRHQKSSPLRYLQATVMQDRVRAALAQSQASSIVLALGSLYFKLQEAVGMLSSLGARRDRSRSPTGGPPSKDSIRAKSTPQRQRRSDATSPTQESPSSPTELHPRQETFVPNVAVQEYGGEGMSLPPRSSVRGIPAAEGQTYSRTGTAEQWRTMEGALMLQQQPKCHWPPVEAQEKGKPNTSEGDEYREGEDRPSVAKEQKGGHYELRHEEVKAKLPCETETRELTASVKKSLCAQELQCKKDRAAKNRPWFRKTAHLDAQSPNKDAVEEPVEAVQTQMDEEVVGCIVQVPQQTESLGAKPKFQDTCAERATERNEGVRQIRNRLKQDHGQLQPVLVVQHEENAQKNPKAKDMPLEQSPPPAHILVQSRVQLEPPAHGQVVAQGPTWAQVRPLSPMRDAIQPPVPSRIQVCGHPRSRATIGPQQATSSLSTLRAQTQSQVQTLPQKAAQQTAQSQFKVEPVARGPNRSPSYMHSLTQSHGKTETMGQIQSSAQPSTPFMHAQPALSTQALWGPPPHVQPKIEPSATQPLTPGQHVVQPQVHPAIEYSPQSQPAVQNPGHFRLGQLHAWHQVGSSSAMSMPRQAFTLSPVIPTQEGRGEQQMWMQAAHRVESHPFHRAQQYPPGEHQLQPQTNVHAQIAQQLKQARLQCPPQPQHQPDPRAPPQPLIQTRVNLQPQVQLSQFEPQPQQPPPQFRPNQPQSPSLSAYTPQPPAVMLQNKPESQVARQLQIEPCTQTETQSLPQYEPEAQGAHQPKFQSPNQAKVLTLPQYMPEQLTTRPSPQTQTRALPRSKPEFQLTPRPEAQTLTQGGVLSVPKPSLLPQSPQMAVQQAISPSALAPAPSQVYSEAYAKARALARNGFEEAKHCLQEHILEALGDECLPAEQTSVTNTPRTLDPELLQEFLRAAKGMEAFCTPAQLRDMELFTQSVKSQWEACFSPEGNLARAGLSAEALKELCDMLSPEDAHRLAHTQLRECESSLAAIQLQFSGDPEAPLHDSRVPDLLNVEQMPPIENASLGKALIPSEVSETKLKTANAEQMVRGRPFVDEDGNTKAALEKYEHYKKSLQVQLSKNEQSITDVPSDSVTLKDLHMRLQEIQFLRQDTESLWLEFINQYSQLNGNAGMEQENSDLHKQWLAQQSSLQKRGSSLGAALRQIDSTQNHMVDFTDRLDRYLRQPKDITAFTLADTNILKDIKELDENIWSELDQLACLEPDSSDLDPRDFLPLSREVEGHRSSLDQLRQQVSKSEAAARALDHFLMSLRTVEEDIAGVQGSPCGDAALRQARCTKLALIKQSVASLKDKAPQLDLLLQGARLTVTREGSPASCLDMVGVLLNKLEEADAGPVGQQQSPMRESQSRSLGLRKRTLLGELRKLQDTVELRGLNEATMPALQHRLRTLSDLEGQLQIQNAAIQSLKELAECQGEGQNLLEDLEAEYNQTLLSLTDRKQQCNILIELLKTFQSRRCHLSGAVLTAEQTIGEQASYMGKDNLHRTITKVKDIKVKLSGLSEQMDEMRAVSRQLHSHLKRFPDCREAPFEAEADTLMDTWLDVTEKIDAYLDNLQVGSELWDKEFMLAGEIDGWAASKLALFAESHPFHNQQQVGAMTDEIQAYEKNIEHFHKKSTEIQEMLRSQEAPLELQVMETQLRKRMEQVKELFADCTEVFEELMVVKKHLAEKIEACLSAVENIECSVSKVEASAPKVETRLQDLCDNLEAQEEQVDLVLREIALVSSVASPLVLEELSEDCGRLTDAVGRTKDMIRLKREEKDRGPLELIQDERQSFEHWFQNLQLAVNECFENPESRADVETSLQRLTCFLKANDAERRLEQLRERLERGRPRVDPQQLSELGDWLKEQHGEVHTFKAHCLDRQKQMESLNCDLSRLQTQRDDFHEWLRGKEELSAAPGATQRLLKDLRHESQRVDALAELLDSVRRRGIRAEPILQDGDDVIQRYRNLELRAQAEAHAEAQAEAQAEARLVTDGQLGHFAAQAAHIQTWLQDLRHSLTSSCHDPPRKDGSLKAQAVLSAKAEGDAKMNRLQLDSRSLCQQDRLDPRRKQEVEQSVRELEDEWRSVLQAAEDFVNEAETLACFEQQVEALKAQSQQVQSLIDDLDRKLRSHETLQEALLSKPALQLALQHLKEQGQSLCGNPDLDEGLRQEVQAVMRGAEERWANATEAQSEASAEREAGVFRAQVAGTRSWIREHRRNLLSLGAHMPLQERLRVTQAVVSCRDEGERQIVELKREADRLREKLDESRKSEVARLLEDTEQQWESLLHTCEEAQTRSLADDFQAQSGNVQSWLRDRERRLQSAGIHSPPEDRRRLAQDVLQSRPDGDFQVNNLRRRGQTLFDRQDVAEDQKCQVQQAVKDAEEQWSKVLRAAARLQEEAATQIEREMESRDSELKEFQRLLQETAGWLSDLQRHLDSLGGLATAQEGLHAAQTIVNAKLDGDEKVQELTRLCRSVCAREPEHPRQLELRKSAQDAEDRWRGILRGAQAAQDSAEKQMAREQLLKEHEESGRLVQDWLEDKRRDLGSVRVYEDPQVAIQTAQAILSSKPEGDRKLAKLRKQSRELCDRAGAEDGGEPDLGEALEASEELWAELLRDADNLLSKAEVAYSLSRELQAFSSRAADARAWLDALRAELDGIGTDGRGGRARTEDGLNAMHMILSCKSDGDCRVADLQRRARSLCEQKDLEEDSRLRVQCKLKELQEQWSAVLEAAENRRRQLQSAEDLLVSCRERRGQAAARVAELEARTSDLPSAFPWPGLGERSQALDRARRLQDQAAAEGPLLADLRAEAARLFERTRDPDWADSPCGGMEESVRVVLGDLTEAVARLERGMAAERRVAQLLEQHEAAQDWLREQVKGLRTPPDDAAHLRDAVNTLKALLQTAQREHGDMKDLDVAKDLLLGLCTPGGADALTLAVGHLCELCAASERDVRERLTACEARLRESDRRAARKIEELKERAAALLWELSSLDRALGPVRPQSDIRQMRGHWNSLQNCGTSLEELGVQIDALGREVAAAGELPSEITVTAESLLQQHDSLRSRLRQHRQSCSANAARCLGRSLRALRDWNQSQPSEASGSALQEAADEGERLQAVLREAFQQQQQREFLSDCLDRDVFEQLTRDVSETLGEAGILQTSLAQIVKELGVPSEAKPDVVDLQPEDAETPLVAPPRKNKPSAEEMPAVWQNVSPADTRTADLHTGSAAVAQFVTEIIESARTEVDLQSDQESGATRAASPLATEISEVGVVKDATKISTPVRKSNTVKFSPKPSLRERATMTKEDSAPAATGRKSHRDTEHAVCRDAMEDSRSAGASAHEEFLIENLDSAMAEPHQRKVATGIGNICLADKGNLSPPPRRSQNVTLTPRQPEGEPAVAKEGPALEADEDECQDDKGHPVCDHAGRDSESAESATVVAEFVTGLIESAMRDFRSQIQSESGAASSAPQVAAGVLQVVPVEEGEISPPARKSKSLTLSPKVAEKDTPLGARKEDSRVEPVEEEPQDDSQHGICEEARKGAEGVEASATDVIEPAMKDPDLLSEFHCSKTSSAPQVAAASWPEVEGELTAPKRKSKAATLHFEDAEVSEQASSWCRDQSPPPTPQPPKRKSKTSTAYPGIVEKGPTESKDEHDRLRRSVVGFVGEAQELAATAKSRTISPDPPKLSTRRKSKKHCVPSGSTEPDTAIGIGPGPASGPKPSAAVWDAKLAPPKRKSKSSKASPELQKGEDQTIPKEAEPPGEERASPMCELLAEAQNVPETISPGQTIAPTETVIALELPESTRGRPADAKDHNVLLQVAADDDHANLGKRSALLDAARESAASDTLDMQHQVADESFSAVSPAQRKDLGQGEPPVVFARLQTNATELIEIVLFEQAGERTGQSATPVELDRESPTGAEERGASTSAGAFQHTPVTIHVGPDVHLEVEVRACAEEKNKLQTGTKEGEKAAGDVSPGEKPDTSAERHRAQSHAGEPEKDRNESNSNEKAPQLADTALERPKVPLLTHAGHTSLFEHGEIQKKESSRESPVQIEITVKRGDVAPVESLIKMPPDSLAEAPPQPDPGAPSRAQTEDRNNSAIKDKAGTLAQKETEKVVKIEAQDVCHTAATTSAFGNREATVEQSDSDNDVPERSRLRDIFDELEADADKELRDEDSCEDCLAELMSSPSSDSDGLLCGLVSDLLSCKNRSAELQLDPMRRQVKEAEKCRETARERAALLRRQREADADGSDALEYLEKRWNAVARDAAAVVREKEDQLRVVQDFWRQDLKAKTALESLAAELDVSRLFPAESCHEEAERLKSTKSALEEKRSVLGELLAAHAKLRPLLGRAQQAAAANTLGARHQEWRDLERAAQKASHRTDALSRGCGRLLLELSDLRGRLESIGQELESEAPEGSPWDCQKAKRLLLAHAEVKAARVTFDHLKEASEALPSSLWPKERDEITKALLNVKDQLCLTDEWMASQIHISAHPVTNKVVTLGRDGLSWALQMESTVEGERRGVPLLPEEVHRQLGAFEKLRSRVAAERGQLESRAKAARELLPQLEQTEEMPAMRCVLECLEERSKSLAAKLSEAVTEIQSGLRVREKLWERIAGLDSWVGTHLRRETAEAVGEESATDRGGRGSPGWLVEAQEQSAACEELLMQSKDMASELSVAENCQLFDKLTDLREDIDGMILRQRAQRNELEQHVDSDGGELLAVERSLRRAQEQLDRLRFPVTAESPRALESLKRTLLEHKSEIDLLQPRIQQEKTGELYSVVAKLHNQLTSAQCKAKEHEKYLRMRGNVEDLGEAVEQQLAQTKEVRRVEEQYKIYQKLLFRLALMKRLCEEVGAQLQMISTDLDPAQLCSEQQRLRRGEENFEKWQAKTLKDLGVVERSLLQDLHFDSESKALRAFLRDARRQLRDPAPMTPDEACLNKEFQKTLFLKKTVESCARALEVLRESAGDKERSQSLDLEDLTNCLRRECDSRMESICDARTSLSNYARTVKQALQFLSDVEVSLLPLHALAGVCRENLEETRQILASLEDGFQTHLDGLSQVVLHPFLSPPEAERPQESVLSRLLVRMSTLKAKGYLQLENLSSCAESHRKHTKSLEEISQSVRKAEAGLEHFDSQELLSLDDCTEQLQKLEVLQEDLDSAQKRLEETEERCPRQRCRGPRETAALAAWRRVTELGLCSQRLTARLKRRIVECSEVTCAVGNAAAALRRVEEELPEPAPLTASAEELVDLRRCWEQCRDGLDCEDGALGALELRVARLLGVPVNAQQAAPTPLCQQLQAARNAHSRVKRRSREVLERIESELEEKEKMQEELRALQVWLTAADGLLSEIEPSGGAAQAEAIRSQWGARNALLRTIRERLKAKYSESDAVPAEIDGRLRELQKSLERVGAKAEEATQKSAAARRIAAELLEARAGLRSVQERLRGPSSDVADAKRAQKLLRHELDEWQPRVAALEADVRGLETPREEEAAALTEGLLEVRRLHAQLSERAERKAQLVSKAQAWLEEHREMIGSSKSWILEWQSWLAAPRAYATSKCLSEHVGALQTVLKDAAQIRKTLEAFSSVLEQMSEAVEVSALAEQLAEADRQLAGVQDRSAESLARLERAAAEVKAMETDAGEMEKDVAEIESAFRSPETFSGPDPEMLRRRIRGVRSAVADFQEARSRLRLPERADETLTVFGVVDRLKALLPDLEKKLSIREAEPQRATSPTEESEAVGIEAAPAEDDTARHAGASPTMPETAAPERGGGSGKADGVPPGRAGESGRRAGEVEAGAGGVLWWLWATLPGASSPEGSGGTDGSSSVDSSAAPESSPRCPNDGGRAVNTSASTPASQQRSSERDAPLRAEADRLDEPNSSQAGTDDVRVAPQPVACQHFTSQREDFEGSREGILAWLTEMDLQLTDAEYFSNGDAEDQMRRLKEFRREIAPNADKIDTLIVFGENLMRKSAPPDAALIQDELEELHSYGQQVFGRAARFHRRLLHRRPNEVPEEEAEDEEELPSDRASGPPSPFKDAGRRRASRRPPPPERFGGRETPVAVDSIPLEWDHTADVGGSSSHRDHEDAQDAAYIGAPSATPASDAACRRRPVSPPRTAPGRKVCSAAFHQRGYVKLMSECSGSIDDVKRVKSVLGDDRPPLLPGLNADAHAATGVMERWEVARAQEVRRYDRGEDGGEDPERWRELEAELRDVTSWLDAKLPELEALQKLSPSTGLKDFEDNVRTLKETQGAFCVRKRALISLNLAGGGSDGRRARELRAGLRSANRGWMRACGALERWEAGLRAALAQCQDFHESLHSLLLWMARAEQRLCAAAARRHRPSYAALSEGRDALQALLEELRERQAAAASLRAAAARLLLEAGSDREDRAEAGEKVHAVGNKMDLLLRHVHGSLAALDRDLKRQQEEGEEPADDGQVDIQKRGRDGGGAPPGRRPLLLRLLRAALPLHAPFFLLLALGCSVASPDERPSPPGCSLANNFARSFSPMLRYINGQ